MNKHNYSQLQNSIARAIVTCREARLSLTEQLCTALKKRVRDAKNCSVMRAWLAQDEDQMSHLMTGPYSSVYGDELSDQWSRLLVTGWLDSIRQAFSPRVVPQDDMVNAMRPILHSRTQSLQLPIFRATSPRVLFAMKSLKSYVLSDLLKSQLSSAVSELNSGVWYDVWPSGVRFLQALHAIESKLEFWSQQSVDEMAARAKNTRLSKEDDRRKNREIEDDDLSEFDLWLDSPDFYEQDDLTLPIWMMLYVSEVTAQEVDHAAYEADSTWQDPVYYVPSDPSSVIQQESPQSEHDYSAEPGLPSEHDQDDQWSRRSDGDATSHAVADNGVPHSDLGSFS